MVWLLALDVVVFMCAGATLYYALQPATLRIAVGPPGSDDYKVIEAMAETFAGESRTVKLSPITTQGAAEAIALLATGQADLAVGRADLKMPADAQTVAVLRKNYAVLWAPSPGKGSKTKPARKSRRLQILKGAGVGVIGRTAANVELLRTILLEAGA